MQLRWIAYRGLLVEVTGTAEGLQVSPALRGLVLVIDGEGEILDVQGDPVAENHHHEHRPEQSEGQAYSIAQQFLAFTTRQRPQPPNTEAALNHRCGGRPRGVDGRRWRCSFDWALGLFQAGDEGGL
ncbi:hypothetical protein D3C80_1767740 [compost metagenome]